MQLSANWNIKDGSMTRKIIDAFKKALNNGNVEEVKGLLEKHRDIIPFPILNDANEFRDLVSG